MDSIGPVLFLVMKFRRGIKSEEWENFSDWLTMYNLIVRARARAREYDIKPFAYEIELTPKEQQDILLSLTYIEAGRFDRIPSLGIQPIWIDEAISIISLCKWGFPGKGPEYTEGLEDVFSIFSGISEKDLLKEKFVGTLSGMIVENSNLQGFKFSNIRHIFEL